MRLRPINDTVIVESEPIEKHQGLLVMPERNQVEKRGPLATVVSWGNRCVNDFKVGQRIIINQFKDYPMYVELNGKQYRLIREHYINCVIEDA